MATIERFEQLDVWQKARELSRSIYQYTSNGAFSKDFSLRDQINRSSGSIMDNIAEGFEREGKQEFIQFLSYAKSSAAEVRSQLYRALDRSHISEEEFQSLLQQAESIGKMIGGFMNYLKRTEIKGLKYKINEPVDYYNNVEPEI